MQNVSLPCVRSSNKEEAEKMVTILPSYPHCGQCVGLWWSDIWHCFYYQIIFFGRGRVGCAWGAVLSKKAHFHVWCLGWFGSCFFLLSEHHCLQEIFVSRQRLAASGLMEHHYDVYSFAVNWLVVWRCKVHISCSSCLLQLKERGSPRGQRGPFVARILHHRSALCPVSERCGLAAAPESNSRTRAFWVTSPAPICLHDYQIFPAWGLQRQKRTLVLNSEFSPSPGRAGELLSFYCLPGQVFGDISLGLSSQDLSRGPDTSSVSVWKNVH